MQGATNFCQLRHKLSFKPLRFNSKSLSLENAIGFYQSLDNDMHLWLSLYLSKDIFIFSTERKLLENWPRHEIFIASYHGVFLQC